MGGFRRHSLQTERPIRLSTQAAFFRGDNLRIIPDLARFKRFGFAYDEYLASCNYLRSVAYDFVLYGTSFVDPLARLFETRIGKTIVYIPPVNSSSSLGSKGEDVKGVLRAIGGSNELVLADIDLPIIRVKRGDEWIRVVNLVDETDRAQKIAAIVAAHEAADSNNIDVVIALGMFKEGANWRWADREVIIGHRGSLTEIVQMLGRLFRDVADKSRVDVHQMLPFALDQTDKERTRQSLNEYLKAIFLSLLLENVIDPTLSPAERDDGSREGGGRRINYLNEAFSDDGEAAIVLDEIKTRVLDATANDCAAPGHNLLREAFRDIVSDVLGTRGIWGHHDEIAEQILRMSRRTVALAGLNVGHIDVDLIKENPFGCLLQYASDACGIQTFRDLRVASCARAFMPFDKARAFVHSLQLKSAAEWRDYCASGNKPADLPSSPNVAYEQEGWVSFTDWLSTGRVGSYRSFQEARKFTHAPAVNSRWREAILQTGEKPVDIPSRPDRSIKTMAVWLRRLAWDWDAGIVSLRSVPLFSHSSIATPRGLVTLP